MKTVDLPTWMQAIGWLLITLAIIIFLSGVFSGCVYLVLDSQLQMQPS